MFSLSGAITPASAPQTERVVIYPVMKLLRTFALFAFPLQQLNLLKAKQKALVEQIEKEKIQSNKGSSYKLLMEQAKLKQATSKVSSFFFQQTASSSQPPDETNFKS